MTRREPSLFARLVLLISLVLAFGAAVMITAAWHYARAAANAAYDRLLIGAALQMAESISVEDGKVVPDIPASAFEMLALSQEDRVFYRVVGVAGRTLTGYADLDPGPALGRAPSEPEVVEGTYQEVPVRMAIVARPVSDREVSGVIHVVLAQTELSRAALARELTWRAAILVAIMSLIALGGTAFAVNYALAPLRRLSAALGERAPGDLSALDVSTPREILPFVTAINHFMARLRERMNLLQRFVADAAHQIRTPLTALSSQIELLSHSEMDMAARERVSRIRERSRQLARLTNQLLSHAMVIHRTEAVTFTPVDLKEIARRALKDAVPLSVDPDIVIAFEAPGHSVMMMGEPLSLKEALANVIDNALRHGAPSRLTVRVVEDGAGRVACEVEDDGPGIPQSRWDDVLMRFGSAAPEREGGGLGFAIAAEVCAAHDGALSFRAPQGVGPKESGFTVVLSFPRMESLP